MTGIIRSELTKICTLPSVGIVTAIVLGLHVLVLLQSMELYADAVAGITADGTIEIFDGQPRPAEEELVGQLIAGCLQTMIFVPVFGAIIAGHEFRNGHIGASVLAVPARGRLLAGKAIATGLLAVGLAVVIAAVSTFVMFLVVRDWNPGILAGAAALAGQGKFLLFAVCYTLTAFALTLLARRTLIGVIVIVVFLGLTMSQVLAALAPAVDALAPMSAGRNLLLDPDGGPPLTAGPAHGAAVIVGWAVLTLTAAAFALRTRDAR